MDTRDMAIDVTFDKTDGPTRLTNLKVTVTLPYGDCSNREKPILRVAEHCPVHETIVTLNAITFTLVGKEQTVKKEHTEAIPV